MRSCRSKNGEHDGGSAVIQLRDSDDEEDDQMMREGEKCRIRMMARSCLLATAALHILYNSKNITIHSLKTNPSGFCWLICCVGKKLYPYLSQTKYKNVQLHFVELSFFITNIISRRIKKLHQLSCRKREGYDFGRIMNCVLSYHPEQNMLT